MSITEIKFTVVIPLYNKERMILRTLCSVLTQSYSFFEVLVIDDGSTDKSVELIEKNFCDDRVRIIRQANAGVSAARNKGIENASGDYIAFLDADDEWMPFYLEYVLKAIEKYPNAALYSTPGYHRDLKTGIGINALLKKYKGKIEKVDIFKCSKLCAQTSGVVLNKKWLDIAVLDFPSKGFPVDLKYEEDVVCVNSMAFLSDCVYIGYTMSIKNNNVAGQLTGYTSREDYRNRILGNSAVCLSYLMENYLLSGKENRSFEKHVIYEFRKYIIMLAQYCEYADIVSFCEEIAKNKKLDVVCRFDIGLCKKIRNKFVLKMLFKLLRVRVFVAKHIVYKEI